MTVISTGPYTDPAELAKSIQALCRGLEAQSTLVPKGDGSIEIQSAFLWSKVSSWISAPLEPIKPLVCRLLKNNDQMLASSPGMDAAVRKISSLCAFPDDTLPVWLRQNNIPIPFRVMCGVTPTSKQIHLKTLNDHGTTPVFETVLVPYGLLKSLPCRAHLLSQSADGKIQPTDIDDFSIKVFNAFINYQINGHIEPSLSQDELIELAQLADAFEHKELVKKIIVVLIDFLRGDGPFELLYGIIELIIMLDIQDQELITRLLARGKRLKNTDLIGKELEKKFPGNWLMQYVLAQCYEHGIGMEKNFQEALHLYNGIACQKKPWGQCELGRCYHYVLGDYKKAFEWYTLAADQGFPLALYHQAVCYTYGLGMKPDTAKALEIFQQLAKEKNKLGLYGLGNFFKNGTGVPKDVGQAIRYYEEAGNEPRALYELSELYKEKDPQKALTLCAAAADQGLREAEYRLGKHFHSMKDLQRAMLWYKRSSIQGHKEATAALNQLIFDSLSS